MPHETHIRMLKAIEWVGHFFGLIDTHLHGTGKSTIRVVPWFLTSS
jgi:hypothetical protein